MTAMFTRIVADIKFLRLYTCTRCGKQQQGSTESRLLDVTYTSDLTFSASALAPNPHHMPIGWGSYLDGIRCWECV